VLSSALACVPPYHVAWGAWAFLTSSSSFVSCGWMLLIAMHACMSCRVCQTVLLLLLQHYHM